MDIVYIINKTLEKIDRIELLSQAHRLDKKK